jgi:phosphoglucosamine mutase
VAALQVLAAVQKSGRRMSEVCHRFDPVPQMLKNVRFSGASPLGQERITKVIEAARERLGSGGRLVIRASGTEPLIRVMGESDDRALMESVVDDVCDALSARVTALAAE